MKKATVRVPARVLGWLEYKLNSQEIDYIWRCIGNKSKEKANDSLIGHLSGSYFLQDKSDWFWMNTLIPLMDQYKEEFSNIGDNFPTNLKHPYYLERWWVNYQKQCEYNPLHNHNGIYSFVVWMKIPYNDKDQQKIQIAKESNLPSNGIFQIHYTNILGEPDRYFYRLNPEDEGTLLFFPSALYHSVNPYFNCDGERISVSGNIRLNTAKRI